MPSGRSHSRPRTYVEAVGQRPVTSVASVPAAPVLSAVPVLAVPAAVDLVPRGYS